MAALFILEHVDDDPSYFSNLDSALDRLRALLELDDQLENYILGRYELDEVNREYVLVEYFDLDGLIEVDDDALSYIDSSDEN